jgi:hypothetical protein
MSEMLFICEWKQPQHLFGFLLEGNSMIWMELQHCINNFVTKVCEHLRFPDSNKLGCLCLLPHFFHNTELR